MNARDLEHPIRHPFGPAENSHHIDFLGDLLDLRKTLQRIDASRVSDLNTRETLEKASHDLLVGFEPEGRLDDHPDRFETSKANLIDVFFPLDDKNFLSLFERNLLKPWNPVMRATAQNHEMTTGIK